MTTSTGDYAFENATFELKCSIKIPNLLHLKGDRLKLKWTLPNNDAAIKARAKQLNTHLHVVSFKKKTFLFYFTVFQEDRVKILQPMYSNCMESERACDLEGRLVIYGLKQKTDIGTYQCVLEEDWPIASAALKVTKILGEFK